MIATSATVAAPTPISGDRQPRVDPDGEHDRQRLDHLDRAREEGAEEQEDVAHRTDRSCPFRRNASASVRSLACAR